MGALAGAEALRFQKPYPLCVCEAGAFRSEHRAMRPRSRQQVFPRVEHVRNAHEAQTDCSSISTNPVGCLHRCSPLTSSCHGQRHPTAVRMSRARQPSPALLALWLLYRSVGLRVRHHCTPSRYKRAYETQCWPATNTSEATGFCFVYWWVRAASIHASHQWFLHESVRPIAAGMAASAQMARVHFLQERATDAGCER